MRATKSSMNKTVLAAKLGRGDRNRSEPSTSVKPSSGVPSMPPVKKQLFNSISVMGDEAEQRKRSPGKKKEKQVTNAQSAYQTL